MRTRTRMAGVAPWLVLIGLLLLLWAGQRRLLYLPSGRPPPLSTDRLPGGESISIPTTDGLGLGAWFVPASSPRPAGTILVFNGNAGNRGDRAPLAHAFARAGFSTLLFDYRGYGGNAGRPSEAGLMTDAAAVLRYVLSRPDVDAARVMYFGESLGTGVAVALAEARPPAVLILRSPFTSIADMAGHHYWFLPGVRRAVWDRFDSHARRNAVRCPTLFIAGDRDRVVPFTLSQRLFDAWPEPKRLVVLPGADHNDAPLVWGPDVIAAVAAFAEVHVRR